MADKVKIQAIRVLRDEIKSINRTSRKYIRHLNSGRHLNSVGRLQHDGFESIMKWKTQNFVRIEAAVQETLQKRGTNE